MYIYYHSLYGAYAAIHAQLHSKSLGCTRFQLTNTRHCSGAPLCKGFTGKGAKGEALGCAVLPDRHTVMYRMYCAVQYSVCTYIQL